MLVIFCIIWILAHTAHPAHWASLVWTWECHHVFLTILILIFGG